MEFNSKEELFTFLSDLQGQIANLQETVDKLKPVEEEPPAEEGTQPEEVVTDDEINEIDKLLQGD